MVENCFFYIIRNNQTNQLISQVRFDKAKDNIFDVSISIAPEFRGKGYGIKLLKLLSSELITKNKAAKINAYIKQENISSINVFKSSGYTLADNTFDKIILEYKEND